MFEPSSPCVPRSVLQRTGLLPVPRQSYYLTNASLGCIPFHSVITKVSDVQLPSEYLMLSTPPPTISMPLPNPTNVPPPIHNLVTTVPSPISVTHHTSTNNELPLSFLSVPPPPLTTQLVTSKERGEVVNSSLFKQSPFSVSNCLPTKCNKLTEQAKTPMCLVNELCRFNKIKPQYKLIEESGVAHKKIFYVSLRLTETEEYIAHSPSIKKAQHAAAALAMDKTALKHPPIRTKTKKKSLQGVISTPTVELNSMAMKIGETPIYSFIRREQYPYSVTVNRRITPQFYVKLKVGDQEFYASHSVAQTAKHKAALLAIQLFKELSVQANSDNTSTSSSQHCSCSFCYMNMVNNNEVSCNKSPISFIHENAHRRNMDVTFKIIREYGPSHIRVFITQCIVGQFSVEGHGNGKRASKINAAELMCDILRKLPPLASCINKTLPKKLLSGTGSKDNTRKKSRRIPGHRSIDVSPNVVSNPISKLIEEQQAKHAKVPIYTFVGEKGAWRNKEFTIKVSVDAKSAIGVAGTKKLAKKMAADKMLKLLSSPDSHDDVCDHVKGKTDVEGVVSSSSSAVNQQNLTHEKSDVTAQKPSSTIDL